MLWTVTLTGLLMLICEVDLTPVVHGMEQPDEKTCEYGGLKFKVGDRVTEDKCDLCFCSQFGVMCELYACPEARCQDRVKKDCCYECPTGPNCGYNGALGSVLVPETGCLYGDGLVCYCYRDTHTTAQETLCWPSLPYDTNPPCNATTI